MKISTTFLLICVGFFGVAHPEDHKILVDPRMSPYSSSEDLLFVHDGIEQIEKKCFDTQTLFPKKWENLIFRTLELWFFWDRLNLLSAVTQHEVFGHGYRIRSLGDYYAKVKKYHIEMDGGYTSFSIQPNHISWSQLLMIDSGGVEGTAILAHTIRSHWMKEKRVNPRQASLYFFSSQDLTFYVASLKEFGNEEGHDIADYLSDLRHAYPNTILTRHELRKKMWIDLADPFFLYAVIAWGKYIICGKSFTLPTISIRDVNYLPSFRMGLTPFGVEYYFENYATVGKGEKETFFYAYVREGNHGSNHYSGVGVAAENVVHWKNGWFGFRFDGWKQPEKLHRSLEKFEGGEVGQESFKKRLYGVAISFLFEQRISSKRDIFFQGQIGGKTAGFLIGEAFQKSPILRVGLSASF